MVKSVSSGAVAPNNTRGGRSVFKLAYTLPALNISTVCSVLFHIVLM